MNHGLTGHPEADHHITELLTNRLTEADQFLQAMGYPGLNPQEQGAVAQRMASQAHQAVQAAKQQPTQPNAPPLLKPTPFGQGSLV